MKTRGLIPALAFLFTLATISAEDKKEEFQSLFNLFHRFTNIFFRISIYSHRIYPVCYIYFYL